MKIIWCYKDLNFLASSTNKCHRKIYKKMIKNMKFKSVGPQSFIVI